jgi:serine/threonine protein kinase
MDQMSEGPCTPMITAARCPNCGQSLAPNVGMGGLCPACLLGLAAVTGAGAPCDEDPAATCRVIAVLGGSARGSCYLADRPQGDGRAFVVLKTMDCDAPVDFDRRVCDLRERLRAIDDPRVVRVRDHGVTASHQPYFIFDYIRGTPIGAHCDRFQLGPDARLALVTQVDAVLDAIHRAGLVHGAISSLNILITGSRHAWEPRVLDLGVRAALAPVLPCGDDAEDWARLRAEIIVSLPSASRDRHGKVDMKNEE